MSFLLIIILISLFIWKRNKTANTIYQSFELGDFDKELIAYHEAGHSVIFLSLFGVEHLELITIDPTNEAFGGIKIIPNKNLNKTKDDILNMVSVCLGGRVAEEIFLNLTTTSCVHDLKNATQLVYDMIVQFGMGNFLIDISKDSVIFPCSESLKNEYENEIRKILKESKDKAIVILKENSVLFYKLVDLLKTKKSLYHKEISILFKEYFPQ